MSFFTVEWDCTSGLISSLKSNIRGLSFVSTRKLILNVYLRIAINNWLYRRCPKLGQMRQNMIITRPVRVLRESYK